MAEKSPDQENRHALNLFICWELKQALQETAHQFDRTVADIVRSALRLSLPILKGAGLAREQLPGELAKLLREESISRGKEVAAEAREL